MTEEETKIHHLAIVEDGAQIGEGCSIGPFCHIGPNVKIGNQNILQTGVVMDGNTTIGDRNIFYPYACIGKDSQDKKYRKDWRSFSTIGDDNVFREYTTVNAATVEGQATKIGNNCSFLSYCHIAHDCAIGNDVIISTDTKLAGHVEVANHAIINAKTGIVQFVRIGTHAFVGGFNKVTKDIMPYCIAEGFPSEIRAINKIGMERREFSQETIGQIKKAFRTIIRSGLPLDEAISNIKTDLQQIDEIKEIIKFAESSKLGLARPHRIS